MFLKLYYNKEPCVFPCQEGWHRPVLSLFAKVFIVFSCTLPKVACSQKFAFAQRNRAMKAPVGLLLLRKRELALAGGTGSSHYQQKETERSRRGTPCCTYRCCLWS